MIKRNTLIAAVLAGFYLQSGLGSALAQCELAKLMPSDGAGGDEFGVSVSIDEDYAIVGSWHDADRGQETGSAYLYRRDENGTPGDTGDDLWVDEFKILSVNGTAFDRFGAAVALCGDRALIGATHGDGVSANTGAAYVFRREDNGTHRDYTDDTWVQEARLFANDGETGDWFGRSVSLTEDRALVGSTEDDDAGRDSGSAYVFRREDNGTPEDPTDDSWVQEAKLTASDGAQNDSFGISVSLDGDRALVGAYEHHDPGTGSGAAYVFLNSQAETQNHRGTVQWVEEAKLVAEDGYFGDRFGKAVSLSGDRAIVGAPLAGGEFNEIGGAYVFRRVDSASKSPLSTGSWVQEAKLVGEPEFIEFGDSVDLEGERALIGAPAYYPDGAAYAFRRQDNETPDDPTDDSWVMELLVLEDDGDPFNTDFFGVSVSLAGDLALVGNYRDGDLGDNAGSAYLYKILGDVEKNLVAGAGTGSQPWVSLFTRNGTSPRSMFQSFESSFTDGLFVAAGTLRGSCSDAQEIVTGPDRCLSAGCTGGRAPEVRIFDRSGSFVGSFMAEEPSFRGGIRVACGDVNGDGWDEIITATGPGNLQTTVKVWDRDFQLLRTIFPFSDEWNGGAYVACGDVNGDLVDEIIVGKDTGKGELPSERIPTVKVFRYQIENAINVFNAYRSTFSGGVRVACGHMPGFPWDVIVTAPGRGGAPHIRVFKKNGTVVGQWHAYRSTWKGGVYVASGEVCPEPGYEVVTGPGNPGAPHIRIFHADGSICNTFTRGVTSDPHSGIRVAVGSFLFLSPGF